MDSGDSQNYVPKAPAPASGILSEAERLTLHRRTEQARAAASEAVAHYAVLLAQSRQRIAATKERLVTIEATRELVRQSVLQYARLMKALETSPERTLRLVKETVAEQLPRSEGETEIHDLMTSVVTWCIEAYYGGSPAA